VGQRGEDIVRKTLEVPESDVVNDRVCPCVIELKALASVCDRIEDRRVNDILADGIHQRV
jgi:hypothetical protein